MMDKFAFWEAGWRGDWRKEDQYMEGDEDAKAVLVHIHELHHFSTAWMRAITKPELADIASDLLDSDSIEVHHSTLHAKAPGAGMPFPMHQDMPFYPHADGRYLDALVHLDDATLQGLRTAGGQATTGANDLDVLTKLNDDYIQSVQHSNVKRFDEILSDDFLCSNPDGTLIDRKAFLEQTARPVTIRNLQAHDVNVRLMGDFAIIHARTTYTLPDGRPGQGRYTDIWARRNGQWLAVAAHVTRC